MNFVADEGVDRPIVERLRQDGHIVSYVAEMAPSIPDHAVLDLANEQGALLLTTDKDFGELVFRQRRLTTGVLLIRLAGLSATSKARIVASSIVRHTRELAGNFTVISPGAVRIRKGIE
jgi:predicted nuclease of predicted toxin-antitoxin system